MHYIAHLKSNSSLTTSKRYPAPTSIEYSSWHSNAKDNMLWSQSSNLTMHWIIFQQVCRALYCSRVINMHKLQKLWAFIIGNSECQATCTQALIVKGWAHKNSIASCHLGIESSFLTTEYNWYVCTWDSWDCKCMTINRGWINLNWSTQSTSSLSLSFFLFCSFSLSLCLSSLLISSESATYQFYRIRSKRNVSPSRTYLFLHSTKFKLNQNQIWSQWYQIQPVRTLK